MSVIEIEKYETFNYDELSPEAQERAYEIWRDNQTEYYQAEDNIASLKAFAEHFNINIKDYSLGGQGDFVSFDNFMCTDIDDMVHVRLWKYLKNQNFEHVKYNNPESGYTINPKTTTIYDEGPFTGYYMDGVLLDNIKAFLKRPYNTTLYELIDSCFDKWLEAYHADMYYTSSESCFKEYIGEDRYLENGTVYN